MQNSYPFLVYFLVNIFPILNYTKLNLLRRISNIYNRLTFFAHTRLDKLKLPKKIVLKLINYSQRILSPFFLRNDLFLSSVQCSLITPGFPFTLKYILRSNGKSTLSKVLSFFLFLKHFSLIATEIFLIYTF